MTEQCKVFIGVDKSQSESAKGKLVPYARPMRKGAIHFYVQILFFNVLKYFYI